VKANEAFRDTFGDDIGELTATAVAEELREKVAGTEDIVASALSMLTAHWLPGGQVLDTALGQMKAVLRGSVDNAIATFNASHRAIKEAIKRGRELCEALTEPRLHDLQRARQAMDIAWPALREEPGIGPELESRAAQLEDLLARETFYRDLPAIEQHARAIELEYARRFDDAQQARIDAYTTALKDLISVPGWHDLPEETQPEISAPLVAGQRPLPRTAPISLLRSERDACESRLRAAIRRMQEIIEGDRLAPVQVQSYFAGGIETVEQLDAALSGLREECARLIGAGRKVVLS
jgi:hypothetical protein